jgi:hypothetical protein
MNQEELGLAEVEVEVVVVEVIVEVGKVEKVVVVGVIVEVEKVGIVVGVVVEVAEAAEVDGSYYQLKRVAHSVYP